MKKEPKIWRVREDMVYYNTISDKWRYFMDKPPEIWRVQDGVIYFNSLSEKWQYFKRYHPRAWLIIESLIEIFVSVIASLAMNIYLHR